MYYEHTEVTKDGITRSTSPTRPHQVGVYFEQLRGEIIQILGNENLYQDRIQKLESELSVYKRAYADVDSERRRFEILKQEAEKQKEDLENQLKGHRIITLLDGDGAIFSSDLIAQGQAGGHAAARMLSDSILQHLTLAYGTNQYQLWVYVFFNKRGLMDTFGRVGDIQAKMKFDDFIVGFNQAAERFLMVDVGSAKEAADAKIKVHLEDDIRLPQTYKVIFGGCHDNGYVTNLRSQITAGFKHKLILLRSYTEIAAGIADLELPVLTIPNLFLAQKLGTPPNVSLGFGFTTTSPRVGPIQNTGPVSVPLVLSEKDQGPGAVSEPTVEPEFTTTPPRPPILPSYSSAVQSAQKRPPTPDLDSSGSTVSDTSDDIFDHRPTPTSTRSRYVNPKIVSIDAVAAINLKS
ncbi:hypothetical protein BDZ94DRAFT_1304168 [Collybia nuda]|uniref:DUF7923 domain-containing protein n=1 Tax=Collybia nuda TaxID=64659 RepID=A0A9P6CQV7_9AGAR|nr:hypothetical protein BDZ94DRAFT_1304168 [Collybia nuda]